MSDKTKEVEYGPTASFSSESLQEQIDNYVKQVESANKEILDVLEDCANIFEQAGILNNHPRGIRQKVDKILKKYHPNYNKKG